MPGIRDLKNKVVVITGAGSGIGRATALAFAREGAVLVIADKDEQRLGTVQQEIAALGARVLTRQTDVSDEAQVQALAAFVIHELGRVDVLHNNAGVSVGGRIEDTSIDDWKWLLGINLWGVIYGVHHFLPVMIQQRYGHIVNTSSILGLAATPATGTYATAKFAVTGLGEALRSEVRHYGIGVTTICPGLIDTRIVADGRINTRPDSRSTRENVVAYFKNHGKPPEKVAKAVVNAVRNDRAVVPVGGDAWTYWYIKRLSQRLFNRIMNFSAGHFV